MRLVFCSSSLSIYNQRKGKKRKKKEKKHHTFKKSSLVSVDPKFPQARAFCNSSNLSHSVLSVSDDSTPDKW
jgi:hypothetical protein